MKPIVSILAAAIGYAIACLLIYQLFVVVLGRPSRGVAFGLSAHYGWMLVSTIGAAAIVLSHFIRRREIQALAAASIAYVIFFLVPLYGGWARPLALCICLIATLHAAIWVQARLASNGATRNPD